MKTESRFHQQCLLGLQRAVFSEKPEEPDYDMVKAHILRYLMVNTHHSLIVRSVCLVRFALDNVLREPLQVIEGGSHFFQIQAFLNLEGGYCRPSACGIS
jgi:hypothetical protein